MDGSRPGILNGLCKVHKVITVIVPSFKLILSVIGTPTCNHPKFLVPKVSPLITYEFTEQYYFNFLKDILRQGSSLCMGNLDVDSLFTNIPLDETINICT